MRVRIGIAVASVALIPLTAIAESPMIAVDAQETPVGPVLQLPTPENGMTGRVMYRHTGDDFVVLKVNGASIYQATAIWYSEANCTGQAWASQLNEVQPGMPYPVGFLDSGGGLMRLEAGAVPSFDQIVDCSSFGTPPECNCSFFVVDVLPVSNLGPFPFELPFEYVLNPTIFQDQFQTGNTSRWSGSIPAF